MCFRTKTAHIEQLLFDPIGPFSYVLSHYIIIAIDIIVKIAKISTLKMNVKQNLLSFVPINKYYVKVVPPLECWFMAICGPFAHRGMTSNCTMSDPTRRAISLLKKNEAPLSTELVLA